MAKASGAGTFLQWAAAAAAVYIGYIFLFRRGSAGNGGYPGAYGGGAGYNTAGVSTGNPFSSLLNGLAKMLGGGGGGAGAGKGASAGTPSNPAGYGAGGSGLGAANLQTLADFWNIGNQMLGDSPYANTDAVASALNPSIDSVPYQTLDVSQFAQDFNPFSGANSGGYADIYANNDVFAGAGGSDFSIPYESLDSYNFADY